jgi:cytochrome P450
MSLGLCTWVWLLVARSILWLLILYVHLAAGSDTMLPPGNSCILALLLDPSVQTRAQAELDAVLGPPNTTTFRLPTFSDRPNLPYIDALVKESLRWLTAVPTGVPHATTEEDIYRGWRIPKGSIVIANAWSMLHNPKTYPDPFAFRPERFLSSGSKELEPDPGVTGAFGFGRRYVDFLIVPPCGTCADWRLRCECRACPGRHLGEATLWIEIASMLSAFTFSLSKDKEGREIDINYATVPRGSSVLLVFLASCLVKIRTDCVSMTDLVDSQAPAALPLFYHTTFQGGCDENPGD